MYASAPTAGIGNSWDAKARCVRVAISLLLTPAISHPVRFSISFRYVVDAARFRHAGPSVAGVQKFGSVSEPSKERNTRQVNPLVPGAAWTKPVRVSTSTSAESEILAGAAVRASATSALRSAII